MRMTADKTVSKAASLPFILVILALLVGSAGYFALTPLHDGNGPALSEHSLRSGSESSSKPAQRAVVATPTALPPRKAGAAYPAGQNPMGLADFGESGSGTYSYTTTSFDATAAINSLSVCASSSPCGSTDMTFQLNTVLGFENGGNWYAYWTQDVTWVDTSSHAVTEIENNIWNLSSGSATMYSSSVSGNGQIYSSSSGDYYAYGVGTSFSYPGAFQLILNASVNGNGHPVVRFMYDTGGGFVTYDLVTFPWVGQLDYSDNFIVDGGTSAPDGMYYDAEFVACGPGDWSNTVNEGSSVEFFLQYWNGNNYQTISNGEDHGEDTGETITNTEVYGAYYTATGELFAEMIAGTENIDLIWDSSQVATVDINGPGSSDATLYAGSFGTPYLAGYGSITLWPVAPDFQVSCDGFTLDLGTYTLSAGGTTTLSAGTWADLTFGETGLGAGASWKVSVGTDSQSSSGATLSFYVPTGSYTYSVSGPASYLPQPSVGDAGVGSTGGDVSVFWQLVQAKSSMKSGSVDVGQEVTFSVSLTSAANDTFSWSGLPSGCSSANASEIACRPVSAGTSHMTVEVTDGNGYHATSAALGFTTFSDPTIGPADGSPASSDVGQTVVFSVASTPGSGGDITVWSGLPTGCESANSTSVTCAPSEWGTFTINVTITDSNGLSASSSAPFTVFAMPTVGSVGVSPGTTILAGGGFTFNVSATPGSGGLVYVWNNLPSGCQSTDSDSVTCTPSVAGTWNVTVTVTDSNHGGATSLGVTVTVQPSFLGLPALEGYALLGVVLAAAIAAILAVALRRRNRRREEEASDPTIAERVRMYSGGAGTASGPGSASAAGGMWADGVPTSATASFGVPSAEPESNVGLDPASAAMSTPLINPPDRVCWHCQFENPPGSRYCSKCALPLAPPAPPGSPPPT